MNLWFIFILSFLQIILGIWELMSIKRWRIKINIDDEIAIKKYINWRRILALVFIINGVIFLTKDYINFLDLVYPFLSLIVVMMIFTSVYKIATIKIK